MDIPDPTSATRASGPGRPRSFDAEHALDSALTVFWQKGYEGASLSDLTRAMGIGRPSLYAAFGNKEALFRKALARYMAGPAATLARALDNADVRDAIQGFLVEAVEMLTCPDHPSGCLVVQGALSSGTAGNAIRAELARHREATLAMLARRLADGREAGQLPAACDVDALARFIATVHQGLSVQASSGAGRDELLAVVEIALAHWPAT